MTLLPDEVSRDISPKPRPAGSSFAGGNAWIAEAEAQYPDRGGGARITTGAAEAPKGEEAAPAKKITLSVWDKDAAAVIPHLPPFSLDRLRKLRAQMGDGLDLGFKFYLRDGAPETDKYKECDAPIIFQGINIISARTSGGKTLLLKSLCARILSTKPDYHVVFFSLEEPELDIEESLLSGYLWNKEKFPWLPDSGETPRTLEAITVKKIHDFTKNSAAIQDPDELKRLEAAARDLEERLHVITIENLDEAALSFAGGLEEKHKADFTADPPKADFSNAIRALILSYLDMCAGKVVFFIDYAQRVHHKDGEGNASYKELQRVMHDLIGTARAGAVIFLAAQSNRTVATGTAAGHAEKGSSREATEYFNVYGEQLREAADLEQAADKIIYTVIDRSTNRLNMRFTKYRHGNREQFAAARIFWGVQSVRLDKFDPPTLRHEPKNPPRDGGAGKGRGYKGDIMETSSPAKKNADDKPGKLDADEQALLALEKAKITPRQKGRTRLMG